MAPLKAGTIIAGRFEIERRAGSGGMGTVYRAQDRVTGAPVAVKILSQCAADLQGEERFLREGQILSELRHPGIVSYVAEGETPDRQRFLVMEWLDGEDLAQRLRRGPMQLSDAIGLLLSITDALALAHERGVVHRDLKPTNLFLAGHELARVKVLDFGIARLARTGNSLTHSGLVIGTPEYMAPEQARSAHDVTPAADVFSLGCVLYECLTGASPFAGDHIAAVLARILFEQPASLEESCPGIPEPVEDLMLRMLAKEPAKRIPDAVALRAELTTLHGKPEVLLWVRQPARATPSFAASDHVLFSVVIAAPRKHTGDTNPPSGSTGLTAEQWHSLQAALKALDIEAEYLADGTLAATVLSSGTATDQAVLAARTALLIRERWPEAVISLATGTGTRQGQTSVGEVVDRAVRSTHRRSTPEASSPEARIWLDELTARLLETRFPIASLPEGTVLVGTEREVDASRPLLGKPTPCVGREPELAALEAQLIGCIEDSDARISLITAAAGEGKSRLRHEFLRRIRPRHPELTIFTGRGDMMGTGISYGILGQILRAACGLSGREEPVVQRAKLQAHISQRLPSDRARYVGSFLAELWGFSLIEEEDSALLRAARQDVRLMHEHVRRAFQEWLAEECRSAPVLLVLDDLQWGDGVSVGLLDETLRSLHDAPLFLLALGRPEVHQIFPRLWHEHQPREISLKRLSRKACERLVQQVLGQHTPAQLVGALVEQSAGSPLFLEELIRSAAEGDTQAQPHTVLAMLQARIGRFSPELRHMVRAASVFGRAFWPGGVAAVLGIPKGSAEIERGLRLLVDAEVFELRAESRLPNEPEYWFRHALMREAAYGLLSADDLRVGHRAAGEFLESCGSDVPALIAEHYLLGSEPERAIPYSIRAGSEAARLYDLVTARGHYRKALTALCELTDTPARRRAIIDCTQLLVSISIWAEPLEELVQLLNGCFNLIVPLALGAGEPGSDLGRFARGYYLLGRAQYSHGRLQSSLETLRHARDLALGAGERGLAGACLGLSGHLRYLQGRIPQSVTLLSQARRELADQPAVPEYARTVASLGLAKAAQGEVRQGLALVAESAALAVEHSFRAAELQFRCQIYRLCQLWEELEQAASEVLGLTQNAGDLLQTPISLFWLARTAAALGRPGQAIAHLEEARDKAQKINSNLFQEICNATAAEVQLAVGDPVAALSTAREALGTARRSGSLSGQGIALRVVAQALLSSGGDAAEAATHFRASLDLLNEGECWVDAAMTRIEWAQLALAQDRPSEAHALLLPAVQILAHAELTGPQTCAQSLLDRALTRLQRSEST